MTIKHIVDILKLNHCNIKAVVFLVRKLYKIKKNMKEIMLRLYKLLLLVLFSCTASLPGMEQQSLPDIIRQTPLLPGAIRQTGIIETIVRDAFCGGLIKPSLLAVSMFFLLADQEDSPCNLRCHWKRFVGFLCIAFTISLKGIGFTFEVANNHPTERAVVWRDRFRLLYGIVTVCALLNSNYLFDKII